MTTADATNSSPTETIPRGITGDHTRNGTPIGFTALTPFLALADAANAIDFYRDVLDAQVLDVTRVGGVVVHAELDFGDGRLQIGEPSEAYALIPPPAGEAVCYSLGLYRPEVDPIVERAVAAGATIREAPTTFASGDRYASIRDPFGVRWTIMSRVEDLSSEESAARVAAWAAEQG